MAIFTGSGVAIVTPFHADGSINYDKLEELIDFHCNNGTDSIIICGTTGEASTLTHEEHLGCIKYTVDKVNKRIPVIAGTGSNETSHAFVSSVVSIVKVTLASLLTLTVLLFVFSPKYLSHPQALGS